MKKLEFKRDQYKDNRGTWSRFYDISCRKCNGLITIYQKDGPGELRRMYLDRFAEEPIISDDQHIFRCEHCGAMIGVPYIYEKENRPAIRLFVESIVKKLHKK